MSGTNIDHTISIIVFLAAMLIFIGLFSQTVETGISYQQHNALSTKTSDLLDNLLLNPGTPLDWGQTDWAGEKTPTSFGLQDPEFIQYKLSPFSLMRLHPTTGSAITYQGQTFWNETTSLGSALLVPSTQVINYSQAAKMMGINGTYGFSLTISPTVEVIVSEISHTPLTVSVTAKGSGSPLSNAEVTFCLITSTGNDPPAYPTLDLTYGSSSMDQTGSAYLDLQSFNVNQKPYFIIVQVSLSGLSGMGYYGHSYDATSIVPIITSFDTRTVLLAHSYGINNQGYDGNLTYNAIFLRAKDMIQTTINNGADVDSRGMLYCNATPPHECDILNIDTNINGILVIAYSKSASDTGIVIMPWGLSSLGVSATLGGQHINQDWVSTDIRQISVNGIPYQAVLALWSDSRNGVTG
jgi:hypothetical protein